MALATLSIDLEARLAKFEEGMDRAARISEKNAAQIRRTFDDLKLVTGTIGATLTAAFAGFSITQFIRGTVDGIDALNDLKDATGSSIENLSALEDVALRGGTSVEQMSTALLKFNKVLSEAKPDNDTGRIIKSLGLDAERLKQIDPAEALRQVAVALNGFADDGNKARAVQELFGKSTKDVAKFLKDLADQGSLVAKVTTEQAEEAKKFNDQLDALAKNSVDLARKLTKDLIPALAQIAEGYNKGGVKAAFDALGEQIGLGAEYYERRAIDQLQTSITGLERERRRLQTVLSVDITGTTAERLKVVNDELAKQNLQLDGMRQKYLRLSDGAAGAGRGFVNLPFSLGKESLDVPSKGDSSTPKREQISEASRALASYIDQLDRQLAKEEDLTESQKALNFLRGLGTAGEIPQVRELVLQLANQRDAQQQVTEAVKEYAEAQEKAARLQSALDAEIDSFSGAAAERRKQELTKRLEDRLASGEVFPTDRLEAIVKAIGAIGPQLEKTSDEIDEFTKRAAQNIQDSLGDTLKATLTGDFASIGDRWRNLILDMIAQAASAKLGKVLLGDFAKTGDIGGIFGDALKWLTGSFGGSSGTVSGQISPGGDYDIGLASAAPSSPMVIQGLGTRARAASAGATGDSGLVVYQTNHFGNNVSRAEVVQAVVAGNEALKADLMRARRRGTGAFAQ